MSYVEKLEGSESNLASGKQWQEKNEAIQNQRIDGPDASRYLNLLRMNLYKRQSEPFPSKLSRKKRSNTDTSDENQDTGDDLENVEQSKRFDNSLPEKKVDQAATAPNNLLNANLIQKKNDSISNSDKTYFHNESPTTGSTIRNEADQTKTNLLAMPTTHMTTSKTTQATTQVTAQNGSNVSNQIKQTTSNSITLKELNSFNSIMKSDTEKTIYESFNELINDRAAAKPSEEHFGPLNTIKDSIKKILETYS
jgi:hypothetical protein